MVRNRILDFRSSSARAREDALPADGGTCTQRPRPGSQLSPDHPVAAADKSAAPDRRLRAQVDPLRAQPAVHRRRRGVSER
jgi:hypothetical protein